MVGKPDTWNCLGESLAVASIFAITMSSLSFNCKIKFITLSLAVTYS